jgi:type I restriction enzyme, S subunit
MIMHSTIHPLFGTSLPNNWRLVTANDIKSPDKSSCVAGPFGSNISSKYFVETGVPVIRGNNLRDDLTRFVPHGFAFVSEEQAQRYIAQHVRGGDLVFTCWGTIGQVGLIPNDGPFQEYIISNKQLKLRPNPEIADPLYLFYYFASPQMVQHIRNKAVGAAVPGINLGILKGLPIVLPPLPIQKRIASILGGYDDLIEVNRRRIALAEEATRKLFDEWFVRYRFSGRPKLIDTPDGKIPEGWAVQPFTDVCEVLSGGTPRKDQSRFWGGSIPFFTPRDAPTNAWALRTDATITEEGLSSCNSLLYEVGTVFITARGTVGKIALAGRPMAMNQSCYALKARVHPQAC